MGRKFHLVIFDCDGTLVDSEQVNNLALLEIINEYSPVKYDIDHAIANWVGKTTTNILLQIQMETGFEFPKGLGPRYISRVNAMYESNLQPVVDSIDLVRACAKTMNICVASNGERGNVLKSLTLAGFMPELFSDDRVFTKNQVKHPKPAPDLFLFAAQEMGADPAHTIVIEDSASGVAAGRAAGMVTIGFTGTSHDGAAHQTRLENAGANHVVERLIHIRDFLGI